MKSILLDTHVWIWYLSGDRALKPRIRRLIESEDTRIAISPCTLWEAQMLGERGRVDMSPNPQAWLEEALTVLAVEDAPFTRQIGMKLATLSFRHNDPIDRFLAATALVHGTPLVTADKNLLELEWLATIDAR